MRKMGILLAGVMVGMLGSAVAQSTTPVLLEHIGLVNGIPHACEKDKPVASRNCYALTSPGTAAPAPANSTITALAAAPAASATPLPSQPQAPAVATSSSNEKSPKVEDKDLLQSATKAEKVDAFKKLADYAKVELSVPSSPAFAILGITPDKVQRPGSIRDFVASIARGVGEDGKPVNGLALDISPASVFFREHVRGGETYSRDTWRQILARTTLSFASTTTEQETGASRLAWGIRVGLIDQADPGLYWKSTIACLKAAKMPVIPGGKKLDSVEADVDKCDPSKNPDEPLWAKPSLYLGYGKAWYSSNGSLTNRSKDSNTFWLSGSIGLLPGRVNDNPDQLRTLLQGYVSRSTNDRTPDPDNSSNLLKKSSSEVVARLRTGRETWHAFVDVGQKRIKLAGAATDKVRHFALGAELKIDALGEDTWLQLASVKESGFANGKDVTATTLNLKFGVPFLQIPGPKDAE